MRLIRHLQHYVPDRPVALAIGNFDGLHRGHQAVLERMQAVAKQSGLVPGVLTFEPHPRRYFSKDAPAFRLQTLHDKLSGLRDAGVERVFALRFNAAFAALSAEDFLQAILQQGIDARAVITGENFAFGQGRGGSVTTLRAWGETHGVASEQLAPVMAEGDVCSSTAIRRALDDGDMAHAAALLGRPYSLSGRVQHGKQRGRTLGFPTANLQPASMLKLPRMGVYAVRIGLRGRWHDGVANLGLRPTLGDLLRPQLEAHLFGAHDAFYGERITVRLMHHLRDEKRFDSLDALAHQMTDDATGAQQFLKDHP